MFTKAKIKQLNWKAQHLDRFKISSFTFFYLARHGNLLRFFFDFPISIVGLVSVLVFIAFFLSYLRACSSFGPPWLFVFFSAFLMMLFGVYITSCLKPVNENTHFTNYYQPGSSIQVQLIEELRHSEYYFKYKGLVNRVGEVNTSGYVLIRFIRSEENKMRLDEGLMTFEDLKEFNDPMNPGAFDFKVVMKRKRIYHQLTLQKGQYLTCKRSPNSLNVKALVVRDLILNSLKEKGFSKDQLTVIEALLLGRRQELSNELMTDYQNAGAMHLLAISGLHIGIILFILNTILKPLYRLKYGKTMKVSFMIVFLWVFAFLSGLSASVIRAVMMFTILSIGLYSERKSRLDHYLGIAFFISLIVNPMYIFDLGFQLSYLAVLWILVLSPMIKKLWKPRPKMLRYFWNLLAISLAAQLGVLPLSLFYFHNFSAAFLLSSMCIIPFLGLILGMGYVMLMLSFFNQLPAFYIEAYGWVISMMNKAIELLGSLEMLIFDHVYFTSPLIWLSYFLMICLLFAMKTRVVKWLSALILGMILCTLVLVVEKSETQRKDAFIVFQQYRQSLIVMRNGSKASVYRNQIENSSTVYEPLMAYQLQHYSLEYQKQEEMKHFFIFNNMRIMVIDHDLNNADFKFNPDIIVLMNSPKINLERFVQKKSPKIIVADGSNFFSFKSHWQSTAEKYGIYFHDTAQKGAYTLELPS